MHSMMLSPGPLAHSSVDSVYMCHEKKSSGVRCAPRASISPKLYTSQTCVAFGVSSPYEEQPSAPTRRLGSKALRARTVSSIST